MFKFLAKNSPNHISAGKYQNREDGRRTHSIFNHTKEYSLGVVLQKYNTAACWRVNFECKFGNIKSVRLAVQKLNQTAFNSHNILSIY